MEKEFIPYEQALELAKLNFNEKCFGYYGLKNELYIEISCNLDSNLTRRNFIATPTFSQAFRWLRHKHNCVCEIIRKEDGNHSEFIGWVYIDGRKIDVVSYWDSKSYEEAELACLIKLIEIIKAK
jgi:hypothetical protein